MCLPSLCASTRCLAGLLPWRCSGKTPRALPGGGSRAERDQMVRGPQRGAWAVAQQPLRHLPLPPLPHISEHHTRLLPGSSHSSQDAPKGTGRSRQSLRSRSALFFLCRFLGTSPLAPGFLHQCPDQSRCCAQSSAQAALWAIPVFLAEPC